MSTAPQNVPNATHANDAATVFQAVDRGFDLGAALNHFAATADALGAPRPASDELTKMASQVVGLTNELFPGGLAVETSVDPEMRDDVCLLFQVDSNRGVDEIVALDQQWHRGVAAIALQWPGLFCLSIDARE